LRRKLEDTGGSYQYSIPRADASTFIARASASDDIWEIGPEGPPRPVVQSPRKDGTQLGRIAHLPLILSLLVALLAGASFGVHSRGSLSPWKRGLFAAAGAVLALLAALAVSLAVVLAAS
jgi:hypothetical protein